MKMAKKTGFGTDGVRGPANKHPMTWQNVGRLAMAVGVHFRNGERQLVVIGKDTRRSSYMFENALTAAFLSVGVDVRLLGPAPTPAVPLLTSSLNADYGVMISASHNPYYDNGIKLFRPDGTKLSPDDQRAIEVLMDSDLDSMLVGPHEIGEAKRIEVLDRYTEAAKGTLPKGTNFRLHGKGPYTAMRVVLDCANGAAYKAAPQILRELGAGVVAIGVEPNGFNINENCGSTDPDKLREMVCHHRANLGIALDGDADRVVLVDENGEIIDGDQIIASIVGDWKDRDKLQGAGIVGTIISGLGLERFCKSLGLEFHRTPVGDRFIGEKMRELGINVGGEESGHIILSDFTTTGDGLIASLQILEQMKRTNRSASEVCHAFTPVPRITDTVATTKGKALLEDDAVKQVIEDVIQRLGKDSRLIVRPSGTEPKIRIMAEGENRQNLQEAVEKIKISIETAKV